MTPSLYAFDVDDTLEVSDGPVPVAALRELVEQGHVVGLCGNWAVLVRAVPDWQRVISFLGPLGISKAEFLAQLKLHVAASDYVMGETIRTPAVAPHPIATLRWKPAFASSSSATSRRVPAERSRFEDSNHRK